MDMGSTMLSEELKYTILQYLKPVNDYSICIQDKFLKKKEQTRYNKYNRNQTIHLLHKIFNSLFFLETSFTKEERKESTNKELKEKIKYIFSLLYPWFEKKKQNYYELHILMNYFEYLDNYDYMIKQKNKKNSWYYRKNRYINRFGSSSRNVYCLIDNMND